MKSEKSSYPWENFQPLTSQLVLLKKYFPELRLPKREFCQLLDNQKSLQVPPGFEGLMLCPTHEALARSVKTDGENFFNKAMISVLRVLRNIFGTVYNYANEDYALAHVSESALDSGRLRLRNRTQQALEKVLIKDDYFIIPIQCGAVYANVFSPLAVEKACAPDEFCLDTVYGALILIYQHSLLIDFPLLHLSCQGAEYAFTVNEEPILTKFNDVPRWDLEHDTLSLDWNFVNRGRFGYKIPTGIFGFVSYD